MVTKPCEWGTAPARPCRHCCSVRESAEAAEDCGGGAGVLTETDARTGRRCHGTI